MLQLDAGYTDAIDRQWQYLARPGNWLTGAQRVAVAAVTRAARAGVQIQSQLPAPVHEAAAVFGGDPASPRAHWVDQLEAAGLDRLTYVEVLGICARIAAVDTFLYGVGHSERPLPQPVAGEPSRAPVDAAIDGGFAPTVGPAWPPTALSAVPAEMESQMDLHGVFYLSLPEMGNLEIVKDLTRRQLELVASRTSLLNECFF